MDEPVRIVDLARDLIELSGLEVERDIDIEYAGIRPGEKLFEELFTNIGVMGGSAQVQLPPFAGHHPIIRPSVYPLIRQAAGNPLTAIPHP